MRFVDTNVLLYAISTARGDRQKAEMARRIKAGLHLSRASGAVGGGLLPIPRAADHARVGTSGADHEITISDFVPGCREVLTEDLNHGQNFGGVRAVNPFAEGRTSQR